MPLVVMCGFPSSGKTKRSIELKTYLEVEKKARVTVITHHRDNVDKNHTYTDSSVAEKELRSTLKSDVQRFISKDDVVILDAPNYIKGYRYELFCITKSAQTPHCVIYCCASKSEASLFNESRSREDRYSEEVFDGLVMRFEAPDSKNRWDNPTFVVHPADPLPTEQIHEALFLRAPPPPNLSTLPQPLSDTNFLHEMDKITQSIILLICEAQKNFVPGDLVKVPGANDKVELLRTIPMSELQRLRRQFISYTKTHALDDTSKITNMFVQFINNRTK